MTIGEFIRDTRVKKEMSQRALAEACNISNAEISRIESGFRRQPSHETLKTISAALNISVNELYSAAGYLDTTTPIINDSVSDNSKSSDPQYMFVGDLTEKEKEDVKKYILFLKSQR